MDEGDGMGDMGGDPMVQTMMATKAVDQALQKLAMLYPQAVDPLAQLQQQFHQLSMGLMSLQQGPMGAMPAPSMSAPLPQPSGAIPGMQAGVGL
jgi:hypothetical protein